MASCQGDRDFECCWAERGDIARDRCRRLSAAERNLCRIPEPEMEEIVALFSIGMLTGVGWLAAKLFFSRIISDENSIYFAPALGAGICALVAYAAVHFYQPWLFGAFFLAVIVVAVLFRKRLHSPALAERE